MYITITQAIIGAFVLAGLSAFVGWVSAARSLASALTDLDLAEIMIEELEQERDYYRSHFPKRDKNGKFAKKNTRTR